MEIYRSIQEAVEGVLKIRQISFFLDETLVIQKMFFKLIKFIYEATI